MRNVKDFGAVGDGITKDTAAIQKAIDAGGIVYFPPGTYLTGTLYLTSNGGLHLETGAKILGSPDKEDYNADDFCVQNRPHYNEHASGAHLIVAVEQSHVTLSGFGCIDGNRQSFYNTCDEEWGPRKFAIPDWRPAQMVYFVECDNVAIRDVELNHAPYWTCFIHGCDDVSVSGVRIRNDQRTRNGDGIDIDCCRRVTISDCLIDSGDDCITLRADLQRLKDQTRVTEDVAICNCVLRTVCNAIRVGVGNGIIRRAVFGNITVHNSRTAVCVVSKYGKYNGVDIQDIIFHDFVLDCVRPLLVQSDVQGPAEETAKPVANLEFRNFRGHARSSCFIQGNSGSPVKNIVLDNWHIAYHGGDNIAERDRYAEFTAGAPCAFHCENAENVLFNRISVDWSDASPAFRWLVHSRNSANITFENCISNKPNHITQNKEMKA